MKEYRANQNVDGYFYETNQLDFNEVLTLNNSISGIVTVMTLGEYNDVNETVVDILV